MVLHVYRECAIIASAGGSGNALGNLLLHHDGDGFKAVRLHQYPQGRGSDVIRKIGAYQRRQAGEVPVCGGRNIQFQDILIDELEIFRVRHCLRQYRQQGAVQLHGDDGGGALAQLAGQTAYAGPDFQYAVGFVRTAGGGYFLGNPIRRQEVLPHCFGKMEAMAGQKGLDFPDIAEIHFAVSLHVFQ